MFRLPQHPVDHNEGIGSYVLAPQALLELPDGRRIKNASDQEILADLALASSRGDATTSKETGVLRFMPQSGHSTGVNGRKCSHV